MQFFIGGIFILFGIIFIGSSVYQKKKYTGVTTAKVVDISRESRNNINNYNNNGFSIGGNVELYPIYEFEINGNKYTQKASSAVRGAFIGQTVQLHYNPENPSQFSVNNSNTFTIIGGVLAILAGVFAIIIFSIK